MRREIEIICKKKRKNPYIIFVLSTTKIWQCISMQVSFAKYFTIIRLLVCGISSNCLPIYAHH